MKNKNKIEDISYQFTDAELKAFAKLFSHAPAPHGLERFYHFVSEYIYTTMTIDEAEAFFK